MSSSTSAKLNQRTSASFLWVADAQTPDGFRVDSGFTRHILVSMLPQRGSREYQKISVNLSEEVLEALREMAARDNVTLTEALRRSISMMKFILDAQKSGQSILLWNPATNETERLVFR